MNSPLPVQNDRACAPESLELLLHPECFDDKRKAACSLHSSLNALQGSIRFLHASRARKLKVVVRGTGRYLIAVREGGLPMPRTLAPDSPIGEPCITDHKHESGSKSIIVETSPA